MYFIYVYIELMNLQALQTFLKISRSKSFARVAEELGQPISTISMQIKGLEEMLGAQLFDRSFRPPKLTPIGRAAVVHAERIVNSGDALLKLGNQVDVLSGTYRIGLIATASVRLLPRFLKNASTKAPNAEFLFETALSQPLESKVSNGLLDAAVVTASAEVPEGLVYHEIQREQLVYALPSGFSCVNKEDLQFLQFNPDSGIGKLIARYVKQMPRKASMIVLDSVEAIMECVKQGIGFTILSEPDVRRYADRSIVVEPVDPEISSRITSLVVRSSMEAETRKRLLAMFDPPM